MIFRRSLVWRSLLVFLAVTGGVYLAKELFALPFGHANYWDHRGVFFLIFVTLFPRLTLLFSSVVSGGFLWWLSWLFVPRILVAFLATVHYWHQNPILVVIAWLVALSAEPTEKVLVIRRGRSARTSKRFVPRGDVIDVTPAD